MVVPNTTKTNEEMMEKWERQRSKVVFFFNVFKNFLFGGGTQHG